MLEYDNNAFYYFAITLLAIYLIPGVWFALSEIYYAFLASSDSGSSARTELENQKAKKLSKENTGIARLKKTTFLVNLAILAVAIPLFFYLIALVKNDGEVNTFDPFQILGIDQDASLAVIKKSYRRLSLKFHPDKNPNNKAAEEMFVKITKAYRSLVDEEARANLAKHGNPDGKQALEVSIGLPTILLDNPKVVLVLYLIVMVVVIPFVVKMWYDNSKQFGDKNIKYDSYSIFYENLTETHRVKNFPELVSGAAEFREINEPRPEDSQKLGTLYGQLINDKLMSQRKSEKPVAAFEMKGCLLLHAHVLRLTDLLAPELQADLDKMLVFVPELLEGIVVMAFDRRMLDAALSAIRFSQCVIQGRWHTNHSLMQLPYITEADIKAAITSAGSSKTSKIGLRSMAEYLQVPDSEKKLLASLSEEQKAEVLKCCKIIPSLTITHELFVEEEERDFETGAVVEREGNGLGKQIFEQDLVTLRITFTRNNVPEGQDAPPVLAPFFPKVVRENWWVVLTDKSKVEGRKAEVNIHALEKVSGQGRVVTHELRFMAPPRAGQYSMSLQVLSDCYLGLDQTIEVTFDVRPAEELPAYTPHPEDVQLDNEPTLFEQVMAANMDDSSDDEDEDETPVPKAIGGPKSSQVTVEDVESDDE